MDVGTWGRRYRCREGRDRGEATLESTKGIDHPIPFVFVPTSPRLPEPYFSVPVGVDIPFITSAERIVTRSYRSFG